MSSGGEFEVWGRNRITGELTSQKGYTATALEVAKILATTNYDVDRLESFMVRTIDKRKQWLAEAWLEDHPAEAVIAAWTAGTQRASDHRNKVLHQRWPALAKALDNVLVNYLEAQRDAQA